MPQIVEGVETVLHDDGSYTTYTIEHVPYQEPMSTKETAVMLLIIVGTAVGAVAIPIGLESWLGRLDNKRDLKRRQKLNKEIYHQAKHA